MSIRNHADNDTGVLSLMDNYYYRYPIAYYTSEIPVCGNFDYNPRLKKLVWPLYDEKIAEATRAIPKHWELKETLRFPFYMSVLVLDKKGI